MAAVRRIVGGGAAARIVGFGLALAVSAGCAGEPDGYDLDLRYPLRTDRIVVQAPAAQPSRPAEPGKLDESLGRFDAIGGRTLDPTQLPDAEKFALRRALDEAFGTPAAPRVPAEIAAADPHLTADELAAGSRLYRRHCAHCHGLTGDGRGPTGIWLYPYPRDFRPGLFKATTGGKPTRAALLRVIRAGVPGTSMQPFHLLPDAEVDVIIGYTIHLSLRGEAELRALKAALEDDGGESAAAEVPTAAAGAWKQWQAAVNEPIVPPGLSSVTGETDAAQEESIRRGHDLFTGSAGCASCHTDYGRAEQYRYDAWGGAARVPDLTRGEYRWGKEPADLARRVRFGIPGTAMPANPALTDEQLRDAVAFLQALPAPPRLPADVRDRVYPGAATDASAMRR